MKKEVMSIWEHRYKILSWFIILTSFSIFFIIDVRIFIGIFLLVVGITFEDVYKINVFEKHISFQDFLDYISFRVPRKINKKTLKSFSNKIDVGYVYIMFLYGCYKIGKSKNIIKRKKQLDTGNPIDVEIVHIFKSNDYNFAENILHDIYKTRRVNREWFSLSKIDLQEILSIKDFDL